MFALSLKQDFSRLERSLQILAEKQMPFATAQAVNDVARAARDGMNNAMASVFDRPNKFTQRAIVAPPELAATKQSPKATITARPIQAKYLRLEDTGGTRSPSDNTRKQATALVEPGKSLPLDEFGGIPAGTVRQLKSQIKRKSQRARRGSKPVDTSIFYLPEAKTAWGGGFFRRLPDHKVTRLIAMVTTAHYSARMDYRGHVTRAAQATWHTAMMSRLGAAIATAR